VPFSVGIVGAGWYGCHLGSSLASLGFEVTVFDRHERLLVEASGNNQFRLHLGFHYARHAETRIQSRDGFQRFVERYPSLSVEAPHRNIYAVPRYQSLMDFQTYKLVMASSGIDSVETAADAGGLLAETEGALLTRERVVLLEQARLFFEDRLSGRLRLGEEVHALTSVAGGAEVNGERFDYAIDATWGQLRRPPIAMFFEPTILLYYEARQDFPAVTFVDGPLCSVYPTEDPAIFTLSSVPHTPLGRYATPGEAFGRRAQVNKELVTAKRLAMEEQVSRNMPGFRDAFRFQGVQLSMKTKPAGNVDDRSCYVFRDGRVFTVMSGKIDTIFYATERVLAMIEAEHASAKGAPRPSALRQQIVSVVG
jgi:glycine/D-amino acid oxidase-like deaminating enzyme